MDNDALLSVFCEVEAIVNSRPLSVVCIDVEDELTLTPNHLLRINLKVALAPIVGSDKNCYARNRYKMVQYAANDFWRRWSKEYASTLIKRKKWFHKKKHVRLGDIVLAVCDNSARGQWPIGHIVELCSTDTGWFVASWLKCKGVVFTGPLLDCHRN